MKITTTPINHIEATILFVRACGPVTMESIAHEIRQQVIGATKENKDQLAQSAVRHGLETGWLEKYDEESYCMA